VVVVVVAKLMLVVMTNCFKVAVTVTIMGNQFVHQIYTVEHACARDNFINLLLNTQAQY